MSKPSPIVSGKEGRYRLELGESRPFVAALAEAGDDEPGTTLPAKLVKAHEKARAELERAEDDLVRWAKYSDPAYAEAHLGPLLRRLPRAGR